MKPAMSSLWGYLWRFIGNGGAMGMAYAMLPWRTVRAGITYGLAVCMCLFGTLIFAPNAQNVLFQLNVISATAAITGHIIYGAMLVIFLRRWEGMKRSKQPVEGRPRPGIGWTPCREGSAYLLSVDQPAPAGARHVLHDDVGLARNVLADMAREDARVAVERATGAEADRYGERLAGVEIGQGFLALCRGRLRRAACAAATATEA